MIRLYQDILFYFIQWYIHDIYVLVLFEMFMYSTHTITHPFIMNLRHTHSLCLSLFIYIFRCYFINPAI